MGKAFSFFRTYCANELVYFLFVAFLFLLNLEYFRLFSGTEMAHTPAHIINGQIFI